MLKLCPLIFFIFINNVFFAQNENILTLNNASDTALDSVFFSFIPTVDYNTLITPSTNTIFTTEYQPSGSSWGPDLDEQDVYLARLKHTSSTNNNWDLRIGKGGQIYSFIGPYGEGVPPSYKSDDSQWNDEVWQPVAVNTNLNNNDQSTDLKEGAIIDGSLKYFIHGAGSYLKGILEKPFYSPLMASYYDNNEKAYYVTNWGVQAHIPSLFKSGLLYTTKYKDIGEGILEVTYVLQNFGDDTLNHLNVPWGGVRSSNLRGKFKALPNGNLEVLTGQTGTDNGSDNIDIDESGGFVIYAEDTDSELSAALGIVFGDEILKNEFSENNLDNIFFRSSQVGGDNNPRDYTLFTLITKIDVKPGETFYYRVYYINGSRNDVHEKAKKIKPFIKYGFITPNIENSPIVKINSSELDYSLDQNIELFTQPIENTTPIFLMKNTTTGELYISPDLYYNVTTSDFTNPYDQNDNKYNTYQNRITYKPYDGKIEYIRLLGYASNKDLSSTNSNYELLDSMILNDQKVILTDAYKNKLWLSVSEKLNIENLKNQETHSITPNPVIDYLYVKIPNLKQNTSLSVINTQGQVVIYKENLTESENRLDFSSLSSGVYFLLIENSTEIIHSKIIKT